MGYSEGKPGANFLRFGVGARPVGMGGAFVAVADDVNSIYWNPAGIAALKNKEITLMHNEVGEDIYYQFLAYSHPVEKLKGSLGGSISYLSVLKIQGYDSGGAPTEELTARNLGINLTYAANIFNSISLGSNLKFIYEKLDNKKDSTYGLDIGAMWKTRISGLRFGFNIQNIGKGLKFIDETSPLPLNYKLGGAYGFRAFGNQLAVALDINIPQDYESFLNIGAECKIYDIIALRIGHKSKDDLSNGIRLGGGIKGKNILVDYAWIPRGDFEDSHRIAVTVRFGRRYSESEIEKNIREHFEKGKIYFYGGHTLKAYREFKDILLVAPRHKGAQDFMGQIELNIESAEAAKDILHTFKSAQMYYQQGDLTAARAAFENILAIDPNHAGAAYYIKKISNRFKEVVNSILADGIKLYKKSDYDKALVEMEKVLTLDPDNSEALKYLRELNEKQRKLEKIKIALKKTQKERIKQRKISVCKKKAEIYYNKKQWDNAVENYKKVMEIEPSNRAAKEKIVASYYNKATGYYKKHLWDNAVENYKKVMEIEPSNRAAKEKIVASYYNKATDYYKKNLWDNAVENYKKVMEIAPGNRTVTEKIASSYYLKGIDMEKKGKLQEARKCFETVLEYNPDYNETKKKVSMIKEELQKKAKEYNKKGLLEYSKGNLEKAINYWEQAFQLDPSHEETKVNLERAKKDLK